MSNRLVRDSGIVNPFAKPVLTLEVDDKGQVKLNSSLNPADLCKLLQNIAIDVMFKYVGAVAQIQEEQKSQIQN